MAPPTPLPTPRLDRVLGLAEHRATRPEPATDLDVDCARCGHPLDVHDTRGHCCVTIGAGHLEHGMRVYDLCPC